MIKIVCGIIRKKLFEFLKYNIFCIQWYFQNKDSYTIPMNMFPRKHVTIGKCTYGELNIVTFNADTNLLIGHYCSIAQHVTFILDGEHATRNISSYPFKVKCMGEKAEAFSKGDIIVGDDVWIGYGATILSGVHIGQGAVIAAGAVVTGNVPPYAVVGGVPAGILKYRFDEEMIKELLKIDYSKLDEEIVEKHIDDLYTDLKDKKQLEWIPKKGK